jgi:hypothetical protein
MRISLLIPVVLGAIPAASLACSCSGTQSIGTALARSDAVIIGKIVSHVAPDFSVEHPRPAIINVDVIDSLRGNIGGTVEIAKSLMCYQSFAEDDLRIGNSYVFPLEQIDLSNEGQAAGVMIGSEEKMASYKMFRLPTCSHNALLLDHLGLYTSELISGGGRRLEYYMPFSEMKLLFALGLLSVWSIPIAAAALCALLAVVMIQRRKTRRRV